MTTQEKIEQLRKQKKELQAGGGAKRNEKQHQAGKLTARERVGCFYDPETFQEMFLFARHRCHQFGMENKVMAGDGVITGIGAVNGRDVCVASQDFTVAGGSVGEAHADKICQIMDPNHKNFGYGVDTSGQAIEIMNLTYLRDLDDRIDLIKSRRDRCQRKSKLVEYQREDGTTHRHWQPSCR